MAKEQGTVVKLVGTKPFGFIRRPDGSELFFHFSKYPSGAKPALGDELEYEVQIDTSKPAGKQDFAANITVAKKASATAPSSSRTSGASVPTGRVQDPLDAIVEFLYDPAGLVATEDAFELPVVVAVSKPDGTRIRGASVALWYDKRPALNPEGSKWYVTDHKGEVPFLLGYWREVDPSSGQQGPPINITKLHLDVEVSNSGKSLFVGEMVPRSNDLKAQVVILPPKKEEGTPSKVSDVIATNAINGIISCSGFEGTLDIAVKFEQEKKSRPVELNISASSRVDFFNSDTDTSICKDAASCKVLTNADGTIRVRVDFLSCGENEVEVRVSASGFSAVVKLKYKMF